MKNFSEYVAVNEGAAADQLRIKFHSEIDKLDTQIAQLADRREDLRNKVKQIDQRLNSVHGTGKFYYGHPQSPQDVQADRYRHTLSRKEYGRNRYNYSNTQFVKLARQIEAGSEEKIPFPNNWSLEMVEKFEDEFWRNNDNSDMHYYVTIDTKNRIVNIGDSGDV